MEDYGHARHQDRRYYSMLFYAAILGMVRNPSRLGENPKTPRSPSCDQGGFRRIGIRPGRCLLPITLFSGEMETQELITKGAGMGVMVLLTLALVKVFITSLCLTTGWKGGYIFPTMFAGAALGMAVHNLFPSIPLAVAASATMAGAMVAVMKAPIFSALFAMLIFQKEEGPVIAIATVFSFMATMSFSILPKTQKNADDSSQIVNQEHL